MRQEKLGTIAGSGFITFVIVIIISNDAIFSFIASIVVMVLVWYFLKGN